MHVWDLTELSVEPHQPEVLHSDEGAARVIAINLPAGEALNDHEVHGAGPSTPPTTPRASSPT